MNSITRIGATIKEKYVVQYIIRTLPTRFNPKVLVLEDRSDLDNLTNDEIYGILTAYKMKIEPRNGSRKVVAFKEIGKLNLGRNECINTTEPLDKEEANFVRGSKRGKGKYKEKPPFKWFKYGRIGKFSSKCT